MPRDMDRERHGVSGGEHRRGTILSRLQCIRSGDGEPRALRDGSPCLLSQSASSSSCVVAGQSHVVRWVLSAIVFIFVLIGSLANLKKKSLKNLDDWEIVYTIDLS